MAGVIILANAYVGIPQLKITKGIGIPILQPYHTLSDILNQV